MRVDFYRVEHHTIMSGLVVRYRLVGEVSDFEISASRDGALIQGFSSPLKVADVGDIKLLLERAVEVSQSIAMMRTRNTDHRPMWLEFERDPRCVVELHKAHFGGDDEITERRERYG